MTPWNPPETAPKNKEIILNVGLPWSVIGHWDSFYKAWCYSYVDFDRTYNGHPYHRTQTSQTIKGWLPMPEVERKGELN